MRFLLPTFLSILAMGACSPASDTKTYSVYFSPYAASLDQQARITITDAATFARSARKLPIAVTGYTAPSTPPIDDDRLSAQRADAVRQTLIAEGIEPDRIEMAAAGEVDPKPLPNLAVRRVDIQIGHAMPKGIAATSGGFK